MIAPSVPYGSAVTGSRSDDARLAPDRMPVKHGKKSARHCEKPIVSVNAGPQLARIVSTDSPVTEIGPTLPCEPSEPSEPEEPLVTSSPPIVTPASVTHSMECGPASSASSVGAPKSET